MRTFNPIFLMIISCIFLCYVFLKFLLIDFKPLRLSFLIFIFAFKCPVSYILGGFNFLRDFLDFLFYSLCVNLYFVIIVEFFKFSVFDCSSFIIASSGFPDSRFSHISLKILIGILEVFPCYLNYFSLGFL